MPDVYVAVLADLKRRIAAAQTRATLSVNRELIALYWHVGKTIVQRQARAGWGKPSSSDSPTIFARPFPTSKAFLHATSGACGPSSSPGSQPRRN
jgi:hypothetical protein